MSARRIDPAVAGKLAKILALLGPSHDGERAAAALLADKLVRDAGLSWQDVLGLAGDDNDTPPEEDHRALAAWLLQRLPGLSERDRVFLQDMTAWMREPSSKQMAWLNGLALRARATP